MDAGVLHNTRTVRGDPHTLQPETLGSADTAAAVVEFIDLYDEGSTPKPPRHRDQLPRPPPNRCRGLNRAAAAAPPTTELQGAARSAAGGAGW